MRIPAARRPLGLRLRTVALVAPGGTSALTRRPASPRRFCDSRKCAGRPAFRRDRTGQGRRRDEAATGACVGQGVHPARLQRWDALPVPEQVPGRAGEQGELGRAGVGPGLAASAAHGTRTLGRAVPGPYGPAPRWRSQVPCLGRSRFRGFPEGRVASPARISNRGRSGAGVDVLLPRVPVPHGGQSWGTRLVCSSRAECTRCVCEDRAVSVLRC